MEFPKLHFRFFETVNLYQVIIGYLVTQSALNIESNSSKYQGRLYNSKSQVFKEFPLIYLNVICCYLHWNVNGD